MQMHKLQLGKSKANIGYNIRNTIWPLKNRNWSPAERINIGEWYAIQLRGLDVHQQQGADQDGEGGLLSPTSPPGRA